MDDDAPDGEPDGGPDGGPGSESDLPPERVSDRGEDVVVRGIIAALPPLPSWVSVGPGDDAAVLDLDGLAVRTGLSAGRLVTSIDTLVEGQDFRLNWATAHDIGAKTAAQTLADIAAMGARPVALLVSLAAPGSTGTDFTTQLGHGLTEECSRAGAVLVGGDVSAADQVVLTGTALGLAVSSVVTRAGARPGDVLALAGHTGPSAAGLATLQSGLVETGVDPGIDRLSREWTREQATALARVLAAHRVPRPPYSAGPAAAAAGATALIDTSDGLLRDAARVAESSNVLLDIERSRLPVDPVLPLVAGLLGRPDLVDSWVLTGGEDHALLACFPPRAANGLPEGFRVVGRVVAADGVAGVRVDGHAVSGRLGWQSW